MNRCNWRCLGESRQKSPGRLGETHVRCQRCDTFQSLGARLLPGRVARWVAHANHGGCSWAEGAMRNQAGWRLQGTYDDVPDPASLPEWTRFAMPWRNRLAR